MTQVVIAICLVLADYATTVVGIRLAGPDIEANPLYSAIVRRFGLVVYSVVYLMIAGVLITVFASLGVLIGLIAAFTLVVANNLYALYHVRITRRRRAEG